MIRIYGSSDDLVEIEAGDKTDEVGCYEKPVVITITDLTKQAGARFVVEYAPSSKAVWRIGVEPLDEDVPMPWPISMKLAERGYSTLAEIDADPAKVLIIHNGPKDENEKSEGCANCGHPKADHAFAGSPGPCAWTPCSCKVFVE